MSALQTVKAILEADSTLLATATGGIWDADEAGSEGINRTATPTAFDSDGIVLPCIYLRMRSYMPDGAIADEAAKRVSYVQMLEAWYYCFNNYSTIETMSDRVYRLLHAQRLTGPFFVQWAGDLRNQRDDDIDAYMGRSTYQINGIRS